MRCPYGHVAAPPKWKKKKMSTVLFTYMTPEAYWPTVTETQQEEDRLYKVQHRQAEKNK